MEPEDGIKAEAAPGLLEVSGQQLVMEDAVAEGQKGGVPHGSETGQGVLTILVTVLKEFLVVAHAPGGAECNAGLARDDGRRAEGPQRCRREATGDLVKPEQELVWRRGDRRGLMSVLSDRGTKDAGPNIPREVDYPQHCDSVTESHS